MNNINQLHKLFRPCGQETIKNTVKMYGFKSSGVLETCEECAIAKAQWKNVNKNWSASSNAPGERLYTNISSTKDRRFG